MLGGIGRQPHACACLRCHAIRCAWVAPGGIRWRACHCLSSLLRGLRLAILVVTLLAIHPQETNRILPRERGYSSDFSMNTLNRSGAYAPNAGISR